LQQRRKEIDMQGTVVSNMNPDTVRDSAAAASGKAHASIDRMTASAHHAVDRMASAAATAAERLSGANTRLSESTQEWRDETVDYVRAHPMTAVGVAFLVGFLLSRLTRGR
jgi:ElaB/YqjD/DUF883 family membrane-anchored ribosome-binding protein